MSDATFTTSSGGSPERLVIDIGARAVPTQGDALFAAERQKTRILERTLSGRDVDGRPFEPYSQNGPYYYYPNGRVGRTKIEASKNKAAVSRFLRKINRHSAEAEMFGADTGTGGRKTRDGQGIRFESYADFKASLGRGGVDLRGPRAPHMLQAIAVGVGIARVVSNTEPVIGINDNPAPANEVTIGIYGDEAGRATAHNTGNNPRWKGKHQRKFFGVSTADIAAMGKDIIGRCEARLRAMAK
ncbi:hypothetical protein UFOVP130_40 [uncultured Caudovirales phage]|uniref:Uncharacterized protein n=1 Tax=uncultured Caudovirales phage TaxID=2100421 RepID=A0A6J5LBM2_9CAUD|nr:hypothetical protein UFOVP130_40 [uncultured Caudovirales phage]